VGHPVPVAFDDKADRDLDRLIAAVQESGVPIEYFLIKGRAEDMAIGPGSFFDFGYCNNLIYWPGYPASRLKLADPDELRGRLTDDWYESAC
jgi:hypothetical protein